MKRTSQSMLCLSLGGLLFATLILILALQRPEDKAASLAIAPNAEVSTYAEKTSSKIPLVSLPTESPAETDYQPRKHEPLSLEERLANLAEKADDNLDNAEFETFLARWLATIDPKEIPAALAYVQKAGLKEEMAFNLEVRLVRQWAQDNATAALQWVDKLSAGPLRDTILENITIIRSGQDLSAAVAWANQLPEGTDRDRVMAVLANEALRSDPAQALQLADNLPSTPENDAMIRRAAMEWTLQDQPKALQWAKQLSDPDFRAQVLSGVAIAWSDKDPIAAGQLALTEMPPGREQDDVLVSIAQRWAEQSPIATAEWVNTFAKGSLKQATVESVAAIWSQSNPTAAANWKATATDYTRK